MNNKIKVAWEKRAALFKNQKEAVMQQSLPAVINDYIHRLHAKEITDFLPVGRCKCLDIGCGYGRLATEIVKSSSEAYICGVDISPTFVRLFNKNLRRRGRAKVADVRKLPFDSNYFDLIYCVVTLMYLESPKEQQKAIGEMKRVLKPGGRIVLIEPNKFGDNIIKLFGILPFILRNVMRKKKIETFGVTFDWGTIDEYIKRSGVKIIEKRGFPFFTMFFLGVLGLSKISQNLCRRFLDKLKRLDTFFPFPRFSYVISYIVSKNSS